MLYWVQIAGLTPDPDQSHDYLSGITDQVNHRRQAQTLGQKWIAVDGEILRTDPNDSEGMPRSEAHKYAAIQRRNKLILRVGKLVGIGLGLGVLWQVSCQVCEGAMSPIPIVGEKTPAPLPSPVGRVLVRPADRTGVALCEADQGPASRPLA